MASKNYVALKLPKLDELTNKYTDFLDDEAGVRKCVEDTFEAISNECNSDARLSLEKPNLPAHGKYSKGDSEAAILAYESKWEGTTGEVVIGFDRNVSLTPAYLMYGCPNYEPVAGLREAMSLSPKRKRQINKKLKTNIIDEMEKRGML